MRVRGAQGSMRAGARRGQRQKGARAAGERKAPAGAAGGRVRALWWSAIVCARGYAPTTRCYLSRPRGTPGYQGEAAAGQRGNTHLYAACSWPPPGADGAHDGAVDGLDALRLAVPAWRALWSRRPPAAELPERPLLQAANRDPADAQGPYRRRLLTAQMRPPRALSGLAVLPAVTASPDDFCDCVGACYPRPRTESAHCSTTCSPRRSAGAASP